MYVQLHLRQSSHPPDWEKCLLTARSTISLHIRSPHHVAKPQRTSRRIPKLWTRNGRRHAKFREISFKLVLTHNMPKKKQTTHHKPKVLSPRRVNPLSHRHSKLQAWRRAAFVPLVILQRRKPVKANAKACCLQSKPKDLEGNCVINFLQYVNHTLLMGMQVHDST